MIEETFVRLRTHRHNVHRYRQLLKTMLTDAERQFIESRLLEEESAIETLAILEGASGSAEPGTA
ncbi:hypothetical protein [Bradyrhizobium retamae]|uniref:Uncharacterized protein n=1 Tax=Bradyrhizobium retamae TaxID=1300035 RepID=A0A0R3ML74_9BRAD|nr:hypothetical protein [Bradyrhizobium retamae]KRR18693.1 hypothetical protein CQ13_09545 [Bradyrhizobium retamae]